MWTTVSFSQIDPTPEHIAFDLEEYFETIYNTEKEYQKRIFNPDDIIIKEQNEHLKKIAKENYFELIEQYYKATENSFKEESYYSFHEMLYDLKIVFPFNRTTWVEGKRFLNKKNIYLSKSTLLDLSMFLTAIFRSDRFDDVSIKRFEGNGTIAKIFERLGEILKKSKKGQATSYYSSIVFQLNIERLLWTNNSI